MGVAMLLLSVPLGLGPIAFAISSAKEGHPSFWGWTLVAGGGLLLIQCQIFGVTALVASAMEDRVTEARAETSFKESLPE